MSQAIKIDIWSDIACPWCYLGKHRLEAALDRFAEDGGGNAVEVEYHSYQLDPGLPQDYPGTHDEYLAGHHGLGADKVADSNRRLQALGRQYGLDYNFADNLITNTFKAHELLHFAKAQGRQEEVKERLLRACFTEGRHIGRIDTLAGIAQEAGLDGEAARRALEAGEYTAAVEADKVSGLRIGVRGVPFFVIGGKYALSGAQEPETFLKVLEKVASERNGQ